ncbi:hypothetical protein JNUCC1_01476 [Lentibacillus sp. JNUCC-1]|nr:hypothetical protein [Lentibacillus sp. JNUCC-1]
MLGGSIARAQGRICTFVSGICTLISEYAHSFRNMHARSQICTFIAKYARSFRNMHIRYAISNPPSLPFRSLLIVLPNQIGQSGLVQQRYRDEECDGDNAGIPSNVDGPGNGRSVHHLFHTDTEQFCRAL